MRKVFLIIVVFIPLIAFTQKKYLAFVSGTPFDFEKAMPANPVIYRCNNSNQLDTIAILTNNENSRIKFLNVYPEFNLLVIYEILFGKDEKKYFIIVDLTKPKEIKSKKIDNKEGTIESNLFVLPTDKKYYCMDFVGKKFLGFSKDLEEREFNANDFNFSYIMGESGGAIRNVEFLLLYKDKSDNKLHISKGFGQKIGPLFNIQPPDSLLIGISTLISVVVNNNNTCVVWIDESDPSKTDLGFSNLIICNKNDNHWNNYKIKGNYLSMKGFGEWLTGEITAKNIGSFIKSKVIYKPYNFGNIAPGIENRKRPTRVWGEVFDNRAETFGNYYTGILYLLNVPTRKYIEWNTGQGDSEILLVQDEIVYYRINDAIYKTPIINGEKLGKSELLIKDPRVPDIHWAFISGN